jgi:hypothetical protein
MAMRKQKLVFVLGLVALSLLLSISIVSANSAPPLSGVWFEFTSDGQSIVVDGLQIHGCVVDQPCTMTVLLQSYGICDAVECLTSEPLLNSSISDRIRCSLHRCEASSASYEGRSFRLVAQFADGVRTSDVVHQLPVRAKSDFREWNVQVTPEQLIVTAVPKSASLSDPLLEQLQLFFKGMLLTFISELIVTALYFRLRLQYTRGTLFANLGMIFAIDLLTFPMVWFFFPRLRIDPLVSETFDLTMPILFVMAVAMYIWISRTPNNNVKLILGIFTALLIPSSCYLMAIVGAEEIPAFFLKYESVIILAELFAVVSETALIYVLRKGEILLRDAVVLSLLMNVSSFLLGLLFLGVQL